MIARREIPAETRAQQNIFISMTDLTVSALLVIVILMAFMATQMRDTRSLEELTDLRSQLNKTQSAFSELQAENIQQGQLINQLSQDLSAEADIRTELDETIKKLEQSVVQRSVEISRLDLELRAALQTAGLAQSRLLASQAARSADQEKAAGLAQLLDDTQAQLDAKNLGLSQRDEEISQLSAALDTEKSNNLKALESLGNQISKLELDIAAAEQKIKISTNQATALVGITNELRAALRAAQGTANTLRDNAAQFDRQLASALSIDTPDRQIILERISFLAQDRPETAPEPESLRADLAGAVLEVEMLSKQNANLRATIQTLLVNSSKIIEQLRSK